jgi:hypothetical protein
MSTYICLRTPSRGHPEDLEELSAAGDYINWTINPKAEMGDEVFFYLKAPLFSRCRWQTADGSHPRLDAVPVMRPCLSD